MGTSRIGNMGSVTRATKTMGLTNLWPVNSLVKPGSQAIALAAGTSDVIGNTYIVGTFDEALVGCSLVAGTSARSHTLPWLMLDLHECGLKSVAETVNTPVALVFGRERVGLTNEESQKCHYHATIAADPEYSSLNLATTAQIVVYKVRMAWLATQESGKQVKHEETPYPLVDDLERFYGHLEQALLTTGFTHENHPGQMMNKLRRLSIHARLESQELNILHEILAPIEQQNKGNKAE